MGLIQINLRGANVASCKIFFTVINSMFQLLCSINNIKDHAMLESMHGYQSKIPAICAILLKVSQTCRTLWESLGSVPHVT